MIDFARKKFILLDLDGTLYAGKNLFPYTGDFLKAVRGTDRRPIFLTNNSSRSRAEYLKKLAGLGIAENHEEIYTSGTATIEFLKAAGLTDIFLMATPSAADEWEEAGFLIRNGMRKPKEDSEVLPGHSKVQESGHPGKSIIDSNVHTFENERGLKGGQKFSNKGNGFSKAKSGQKSLRAQTLISAMDDKKTALPQAVVLTFDKTFSYEKFCAAHELITAGVPFYATHPDNHVPLEEGKFHPDIGTLISAFRTSTGKAPTVIGKPEKHIYEQLRTHLKCEKEQMVMIGDRLNTDILGANNYGIDSILVLSGETTRGMLEKSPKEQHPTMVAENVGELIASLSGLTKS